MGMSMFNKISSRKDKMKQKDTIESEKRTQIRGTRWFHLLAVLMMISMLILPLNHVEAGGRDAQTSITPVLEKAQKKSAAPVNMVYADGSISAWIFSTPINEVMKEIRRLTGVEVLWDAEEIFEKVSAKFRGLSLDDAVNEILHGRSYILTYVNQEQGKELVKITMLPDDEEGYAMASVEIQTGRGENEFHRKEEWDEHLHEQEMIDVVKMTNMKISEFETMINENEENAADEPMLALANESEWQ